MEITYLDLFSGVGGFAKGFRDAKLNIKRHYYSEIDKHAIAVYKYNFKDAIYAGDIRTITSGTIPHRPNLISFGFPCQDISVAGKRRGLSGERSGLFFEAIRLIEEFKPEVFIFENVKGLFSSNKGKDFEAVLQTIADLGIYECEWQLVNTSWVLPQNRERIYFIGHLTGASKPGVFPFRESDSIFAERSGAEREPGTLCSTITKNYHKGVHNRGETYVVNFQGKEICNTIRKGGIGTFSNKHNWDVVQIRSVSTPDRKIKCQNGRRFKDIGEPSFTLTAQDRHGVIVEMDDSLHNRQQKQEKESTIRRLTEIECERLQGFPDNWTEWGDYDGVLKKVSRTQRYKQMGNAVTVDWPRMIAQRLSIFNGT